MTECVGGLDVEILNAEVIEVHSNELTFSITGFQRQVENFLICKRNRYEEMLN